MARTTTTKKATALLNLLSLKVSLILALVPASAGCQPQSPSDSPAQPPPTAGTQVPSPPARATRVAITRVDGATVTATSHPQVGHVVVVEGTTTNPDAVVCVLVHPLQSDTWWVQNLPGLPDQQPDGSWSWRTTVFCGSERLGLGEDFELLAIAEQTQSLCVPARQIKMAQANTLLHGVPRSLTVVARRAAE